MTERSDLLIAIPMKDPAASKTRLATCLSDQERHDLALGLFRRTLDVIEQSGCGADVLVVTESARIEALCASRKTRVLREPEQAGLNAACERAAQWATENGYAKMAILPADLALLAGNDLVKLAEFPLKPDQIAMCEATDGGTNCLLASPPDAIRFQYGAGSFKTHRRQAMSNGVRCFILRDSDMRFDIDTSRDLQHMRQRLNVGQTS